MTSHLLHKAQQLDNEDALAGFRDRFLIADPDLIYLDGNSLGRLPLAAARTLQTAVEEEWGERLIRSWNEGWLKRSEIIGDKIATLIGASPGEVLIADSTSVNLFKLALASMQHQAGRHKIVTDDMNFPTDIYILDSVCRLLGSQYNVEAVRSKDEIDGPIEQLIASLDTDTALLTLSHTTFKSGYTYNLQRLTQAAHRLGVLVLWDLSHSAGVVPVNLNEMQADLAVGCTYKYLNGGPGAPAYLYVRRDLQKKLYNPLTGWMGHANAFAFDWDYKPAGNIRRFLSGTPPILALSAVEPGVDLVLEAGIQRIRSKSIRLTQYFLELWENHLAPLGFRLQSPIDPNNRGSHISLGHEYGHSIDLALIKEMGVIPDFRDPNNIRLGFAPLYTSFKDIFTAVSRIQIVVDQKIYQNYRPVSGAVT